MGAKADNPEDYRNIGTSEQFIESKILELARAKTANSSMQVSYFKEK